MAAQNSKTIILIVTVVLALFAASPAIQQVALSPQPASATEISLLGSYHNSTYPFNVTAGQNYLLYLDVTDHSGPCSYYTLEVKFRNATQPAPDSFAKTSSALPSLVDMPFCLDSNQAFELPITISLSYTDSNVPNTLEMQSLVVNGFSIVVAQTTLSWDAKNGGYYGNLFFELWIFNGTTNSFQYDQRYVSLWFNLAA